MASGENSNDCGLHDPNDDTVTQSSSSNVNHESYRNPSRGTKRSADSTQGPTQSKQHHGEAFSLRPSVLAGGGAGNVSTAVTGDSDAAVSSSSEAFSLRPSLLGKELTSKYALEKEHKQSADKLVGESVISSSTSAPIPTQFTAVKSDVIENQLLPGGTDGDVTGGDDNGGTGCDATESEKVSTSLDSGPIQPAGAGTSAVAEGAESSGNGDNSDDVIGTGVVKESFIFGRNICERVTGTADKPSDSETSGVSETFTEVSNSKAKVPSVASGSGESFAKQPAAPQTKFKELEKWTGEEDEVNVMQLNCKLYQFDDGSWLERGRCVLRLNDIPETGTQRFTSRIVARCQGSLRLVLNSKLFPQMTCETTSSPRSLRVTANTADGVRVFVISAAANDVASLSVALNYRIGIQANAESQLTDSSESNGLPVGTETAGDWLPGCRQSSSEEDDSPDGGPDSGPTSHGVPTISDAGPTDCDSVVSSSPVTR